jgi:hypothetical protein
VAVVYKSGRKLPLRKQGKTDSHSLIIPCVLRSARHFMCITFPTSMIMVKHPNCHNICSEPGDIYLCPRLAASSSTTLDKLLNAPVLHK